MTSSAATGIGTTRIPAGRESATGMRVVVVGATGNVGSSLVSVLSGAEGIESILGVARRLPRLRLPRTEWAAADVEHSDLVPLFRGADAVVHLAWRIQPSRDVGAMGRTNVLGSSRVFTAAAAAGVPNLLYASSVGVYSPGPKDRRVDESWPREGTRSSAYARQKAEVERRLDDFEAENSGVRVVRLRPGLTFKGEAASGIRRLFAGPFFPSPLARPGLVPFVPDIPRLRFQGVHSLDVAEAYRLALVSDVTGAFNIAADPVLDPRELGRLLQARLLRVPAAALRTAVTLSWRARLQPTPAGWLDLALSVPLLDTTRAETELGWRAERDAGDAFLELLDGFRRSSGLDTPPLEPHAGGPLRLRELATGVGAK